MLQRLSILTFIALLAGLSALALWRPDFAKSLTAQIRPPREEQPRPQPEKYQALIAELQSQHQTLAAQYSAAESQGERERIEAEARILLEDTLPQLMRCWLGTPWDFNGTTEVPGKGKIACGYFVSTILRDANFKVERFRLAQQASQNIIATFLPREKMHIRVSQNYQEFIAEVVSRGPGICIVGLDSHVAFLVVNDDQSINFIHSSGARPWTVVDETKTQANVLKVSRYRVIGNLTSNQRVIQNWLQETPWPTRS